MAKPMLATLNRGLLAMMATVAFSGASIRAEAGAVLDQVNKDGTVRCAAEGRPGLASSTGDKIDGLAVDLCRAAAVAVLGPAGRVEFSLVDSVSNYAAVREGRFEILFLSGGTIAEAKLAARIVPGPVVFVDRFALMVPEDSAFRTVPDLAGKTICFMIGSPAQRALEASFERLGLEFSRLGFEEDVEMRDAYNVGRCAAMAERATALAVIRQDGGVLGTRSRILDPPLGLEPVFTATPTADGKWNAAVSWLVQGLVAASKPVSAWSGSGAGLDPESASALGLRKQWLAEVTAELGSYSDMLRRHTGDGSPLQLSPGLNAPWPAGILLTPSVP